MSAGQLERLHKRIAAAGICSRRAAETLIMERRVAVNGVTVEELGFKVGPYDVISVDGKEIGLAKLHYIVMNKPKGVLTTLSDPQNRRTVKDYLPDLGVQLKPVGRLDKDTEGLLIFTNDGALAVRLMHPRYLIDKEYLVTVKGIPDNKKFDKLSKGLWIPEGGKTAPAKISRIIPHPTTNTCSFHITIHEGRKRQIRLMCEGIGHPVKDLKRLRVGPVELKSLSRGLCRILSKPEIAALYETVGLKTPE